MSFDSNSWYNLRAVGAESTRPVQWCSQEIVCNSDVNTTGTNASWQFIALDPMDASKLTLRNLGIGPTSALAVSLNGNETQPGLKPFELRDATQQWIITSIEAANVTAYSISNVANGTSYAMAEGGNHMFMAAYAPNASFALDASGDAQQWVVTKVEEINDPAWSATPSATATATTSIPTSSSAPTQYPTEGKYRYSLSGGAIAGIIIGSIVIGLGLIGIGTAYCVCYQRRTRTRSAELRARRSTDSDATIIAEKMSEERAEMDGGTGILDLSELPSGNSSERHELSA